MLEPLCLRRSLQGPFHHPGLPRSVPVLALKVSRARKLLSRGQTRTVVHPTFKSEICVFINFM